MLLANFNGKEHLRHRAVSLRQHGFLVLYAAYTNAILVCMQGRKVSCVTIRTLGDPAADSITIALHGESRSPKCSIYMLHLGLLVGNGDTISSLAVGST